MSRSLRSHNHEVRAPPRPVQVCQPGHVVKPASGCVSFSHQINLLVSAHTRPPSARLAGGLQWVGMHVSAEMDRKASDCRALQFLTLLFVTVSLCFSQCPVRPLGCPCGGHPLAANPLQPPQGPRRSLSRTMALTQTRIVCMRTRLVSQHSAWPAAGTYYCQLPVSAESACQRTRAAPSARHCGRVALM